MNQKITYILNNHPEAVRIYANTISVPKLRKEPRHLLYWSTQADSHRNFLKTKKPLVNPRSLLFKQTEAGIEIMDGSNLLAILNGNILEVTDINILNFNGRPNTIYVFNNNKWTTDDYGRVIKAEQQCSKDLKKKSKQKSILSRKSICGLLGDKNTTEVLFLNSTEYGAPEVLLNAVGYDKSKTNKQNLKISQKGDKKEINETGNTTLTKSMVYCDNSTRPEIIEINIFNLRSMVPQMDKHPTQPDKPLSSLSTYRTKIKPTFRTNFFNATEVIKDSTSDPYDQTKNFVASSVKNITPMVGAGNFTLKGKIDGKYGVTMNLTFDNGTVKGTYYYDKYHRVMDINGYISSQGEMTLTEYENNKQTGKYEGKFDGRSFSGHFVNSSKKIMTFTLTVK